jgi:hypothetical protein
MSETNLMMPPDTQDKLRVIGVPHPFKTASVDKYIMEGMTVSEIVDMIQPDPVLQRHALICVNDIYIERHTWKDTIPEGNSVVVVKIVPMGGGGGSGGGSSNKNPIKVIAQVALFVVAAALAAPSGGISLAFLGGAGSTFSAFGSALVFATVSGVGMLAINALSPPASISSPSMGSLSSTDSFRTSPTLFIEGASNSLRPFAPIPIVLGVHKNVPPLGAQTFTEIIGNEQYLRMIVVWGYGRLKIENIKIGQTLITEFDDVTIETNEGVSGDSAHTIYPDTVSQDDFTITLTATDSWTTRTTQDNCDEISVDLIWASGLAQYTGEGEKILITVVHEIEFSVAGANSWSTPTYTATTVPSSAIAGSAITLTNNQLQAVRHGFRWSTGSRAKYDVRVRRTSTDLIADDKVFDVATWTTLRSITNEDPINFSHPLATTAISIRATDQLNGIISNLSATTSSYVSDFGGSAWSEAVSSNPASLFRHVLQGVANDAAVADSRLDTDSIEAFHTHCANNSFEFNMIRDFQASIYDTLTTIAAAGRGSVMQIDGKWGLAIDKAQTVPTQHFTPRNSWGFEAEKIFADIPHALRMRFANRDKEWLSDERIVYDDGYTVSNATVFEQLDAIGITDTDHVWKQGRFALAQMRLRPERWSLSVDFEYITAKKGDMVLVTHDVLVVGIASGRIKTVTTDSAGDVTGITSDEILTMEAGKSYGVSIRAVGDQEIVKSVTLDVGDQTSITFTSVIASASAPIVGDLFSFGISGSETIEGLLLSAEPQGELTARLNIVPNSPAVYTADTGTIPAFASKIVIENPLPDVNIISTRTDESILALGIGNVLSPRLGVSFTPIAEVFDASVNAQIRVTGGDGTWQNAVIVSQTSEEVILGDVIEGETYDVRLQAVSPNFIVNGNWSSASSILIIGQTSAPSALTNLTISAFGGTALLRWSTPTDLDVLFGGTVQFRHSDQLDEANASWSQSVSIGTTSKGTDLIAQLPLKPGTYLAKVFDKGGRSSTVAKIDTKQATIQAFSSAASNVVEETAFSGIHTNTTAPDGILKLTGSDLFDAWTDIDLITDWDSKGGMATSGTYDFAAGFDLTTVKAVRLTTDLTVVITGLLDKIDSWTGNVDSRESWDGDEGAAATAQVQVRQTDDDPATSAASWTAWNDLDSAEFNARGFDFRCQLTTSDVSFNILISKLQVIAEEL